jgi:hypothetical protein
MILVSFEYKWRQLLSNLVVVLARDTKVPEIVVGPTCPQVREEPRAQVSRMRNDGGSSDVMYGAGFAKKMS